MAIKYDVPKGRRLLNYDFILVTEEEARLSRQKNAEKAMKELGLQMEFWNGLPVPPLD
jgi:hypothetical protein